ncbi:hypothetical protein DGWBC_0696 [Dehalogenimonas sp. WBC-2]|nr:hypothetical protein DGWBC_0696 [Dehalogenimonas sp. WBC-2]
MNASLIIDDIIANLADWRGIMFASIRRIIHDADSEIIEELKWMGTPVWSHNGIVCLAKAFKDKVKITFPNGASLSDPNKIFNAELGGKQWRAIDIYKDDKINENSLKMLIQSTVNYNSAKLKAGKTKGTIKNKSSK